MELKTKRLVLRELKESDAQDIADNVNNVNVSKYLLVVPYPYSLKDAKDFIEHSVSVAKENPRTEYNFGITLKTEGKVIGIISLEKVDAFQETGSVGYWLGEKHHRNGYMTEAFGKILDFGFMELNLRKVKVSAFADNTASNRLIKEKMEFKQEGCRIEHLRDKATGTLHDENIYGLLRRDYLNRKSGNS